MKFTSEDLLKAMGLKLGDKINFNGSVGKVYNDDVFGISILYRSQVLKLEALIGIDYTIIQPKPTLTEDEKAFAKLAHNQGYRYLSKNKHEKISSITKEKPIRCNDGTWVCEDGGFYFYLNMFPTLFQFIKWEDEPYSIEELLGESK